MKFTHNQVLIKTNEAKKILFFIFFFYFFKAEASLNILAVNIYKNILGAKNFL